MNSNQEDAIGSSSPNIFKSIWSLFEPSTTEQQSDEEMVQTHLGLIVGGAALILIIGVSLVAYLVIKRSEEGMSNLLAEKGSSLLSVFESAIRAGMRGTSSLGLQALLEEIARSPDIIFVAMTMPDGTILAHSDDTRIGENLRLDDRELNSKYMADLAPAKEVKWRIIDRDDQRVFLLYRHFTLGYEPWSRDVPEPTIFLGMDASPFEITNSQNRSYVAMLCLVTMLVGLSCLLAINYAQRAADSRKRQRRAESKVHKLEEEVRRNEKLAAIGTIAAGVAHEIRNPLSSIKGYATYFQQRFPEGSEDRDSATIMVAEVNRLNRVITDLLGLAKPNTARLQPICVENVARHVLRLIRQNAAEHKVSLSCRIAPSIPEVMADIERLSQALLNLCLNSIDAMPNGGRLTIAVSGGNWRICILVCDTGAGIAPEIINKVFDPYFTTKDAGTGLGLAMVHKIVSAHKGKIDISSWPRNAQSTGGGSPTTIFRIWLPVADIHRMYSKK